MSVHTLPMTLILNGLSKDTSSTNSFDSLLLLEKDIGVSCLRSIDIQDNIVYVYECPGYLGIGGKVWDSTFILLKFLSAPENKHFIDNKDVLELGSGTGIAGIGLGSLNPKSVTLTDLPEVVPLLK